MTFCVRVQCALKSMTDSPQPFVDKPLDGVHQPAGLDSTP